MSVIQSRGRTLPVAQTKTYPLPTSFPQLIGPSAGLVSLLRGDGLGLTYEGVYRSQPMVYAVVNKLVYSMARLPLRVLEYEADGISRREIRNHPASRLMRRPYPRGSSFDLKASIAWSLHVFGNALLLKAREGAGAAPYELWPVPWRNVQVITDERGPIGYAISINGYEQVQVGPEDVVHLSLPGGISPLEPLRRTLALEDAAMTFQGESLRNGATPRGVFQSEQRLPDQVIPRLREELAKLYAGPENAGRFAVLDNGLKFTAVSQSAVDTELMSQRRLSREEVCAVYDVAPSLLGMAQSTYSNAQEHRRALFDGIASKIALVEEGLQVQLVDEEPAWDGIHVEFDPSELTRLDPEARARMYLLSQQASTTTINERRAEEGLARIDDAVADTVFMPMNMQAVGVSPAPDAIVPPEENPGGTPEQGTPARVISDALNTDATNTMSQSQEESK